MARIARIALDLALVSLKTAKPLLASAYYATKSKTVNTKIYRLFSFFEKYEPKVADTTENIINKLTQTRNNLLPREEEYLNKQIEFIRKKMKDGTDWPFATAKFIKPRFGSAWQYAKKEIVPPMTTAFFNGPGGKAIENAVDSIENKFIKFTESAIKEIDAKAEAERQVKIRAKKAAIARKRKLAQKRKEKEKLELLEKQKAEKAKRDETKKASEKKGSGDAKASDKPAASSKKPKEDEKKGPPKDSKK